MLNQAGAKTDFCDYAIVGNMSPHRRNDVTLDTQTLPSDLEMELTTQIVTPTRGAVARANYATKVGMRVLMTLT